MPMPLAVYLPRPPEVVHLVEYLDSTPLSHAQIRLWTDHDPILPVCVVGESGGGTWSGEETSTSTTSRVASGNSPHEGVSLRIHVVARY